MKQLLMLLFFCLSCLPAFAQIEADFAFTGEEDNRLLKEVDSGKFFVAGGSDTTRMVFLNDEAFYYRLLTKGKRLLQKVISATMANVF